MKCLIYHFVCVCVWCIKNNEINKMCSSSSWDTEYYQYFWSPGVLLPSRSFLPCQLLLLSSYFIVLYLVGKHTKTWLSQDLQPHYSFLWLDPCKMKWRNVCLVNLDYFFWWRGSYYLLNNCQYNLKKEIVWFIQTIASALLWAS